MFAKTLLLTVALSLNAAAASAWSLVYTRIDGTPPAGQVASVETAVPAVTPRRR